MYFEVCVFKFFLKKISTSYLQEDFYFLTEFQFNSIKSKFNSSCIAMLFTLQFHI
jgi:hypothetical protein